MKNFAWITRQHKEEKRLYKKIKYARKNFKKMNLILIIFWKKKSI